MESKRAVIYCRVSTKEQVDEGNSLSTQERVCREYAAKTGYAVIHVFIEKGESAKSLKRTQLTKLLDFCGAKKNQISAVIAYKIDRISRNIDDYSTIRILLKKSNVEIKSTSEPIENTPAGKFMENMIANVAQFDNDVRTERCINGMKEAIKEGRYIWLAPVGYTNIKVLGKATIKQDHQAEIIKWAFNEVAKNYRSIESIYYSACTKGLTSSRGKVLSRSYFYSLLKNELYAGWINRFKEQHKGSFEPIISEEIFKHVQLVLKGRTKTFKEYQRENPDFPLRRFIQHPNGAKLTGGWSKGRRNKYAYYYFKNLGKSYPKRELEKLFCNFLDTYSITIDQFGRLQKASLEALSLKMKSNEQSIRSLNNSIDMLKNKQAALVDKNLSGVISDEIMKDQLSRIDSEITEKTTMLLNVEEYTLDADFVIHFLREFLTNTSIVWKNGSVRIKRIFQRFNFPEGLIFDGEKFRTKEMSLLFKVKDEFRNELSKVVSHSKFTLNTPEIAISKAMILFQEAQKLQTLLNGDTKDSLS